MLLGYNKDGVIEFVFTDDAYLHKQFPGNTAKVTNFWGTSGSHLKELFIDLPKNFNEKEYKVINGELVKSVPVALKDKPSIIVESVVSPTKEVKSEVNSSGKVSRERIHRAYS